MCTAVYTHILMKTLFNTFIIKATVSVCTAVYTHILMKTLFNTFIIKATVSVCTAVYTHILMKTLFNTFIIKGMQGGVRSSQLQHILQDIQFIHTGAVQL